MEGNTSDRTTLRGFLEKIETLYGKARRTQRVPRMMDRGIPTEEVLAESEGRRAKEIAIRRRKLVRLLPKLRAMRRSSPPRDQLLMRIGVAKTEAGRAFGFVKITLPKADQEVTPQNFTLRLDKVKLKPAELRDGHYLLRTNLTSEDPAVLWDHSIQLC